MIHNLRNFNKKLVDRTELNKKKFNFPNVYDLFLLPESFPLHATIPDVRDTGLIHTGQLFMYTDTDSNFP